MRVKGNTLEPKAYPFHRFTEPVQFERMLVRQPAASAQFDRRCQMQPSQRGSPCSVKCGRGDRLSARRSSANALYDRRTFLGARFALMLTPYRSRTAVCLVTLDPACQCQLTTSGLVGADVRGLWASTRTGAILVASTATFSTA